MRLPLSLSISLLSVQSPVRKTRQQPSRVIAVQLGMYSKAFSGVLRRMRRAHMFVTHAVESGLLYVTLIIVALCVCRRRPLIINARAKFANRYLGVRGTGDSGPWQRYKYIIGRNQIGINFRMTDADHI